MKDFTSFFVANTFVKESTQGDAGRKAYMNPKILKVHPAQKNKDRPAKNVMRVAYGKKIGMFKSLNELIICCSISDSLTSNSNLKEGS